MCTLSWHRADGALEVFFNRDERRTRAPAAPPSARPGQPRIVAPTDGDAGGSWIAASERGLVVCLLNGYLADDERPNASRISRGTVVLELARRTDAGAALAAAGDLPLRRLRSFRVVAIDAHRAAARDWDGHRLSPAIELPDGEAVVSSSFRAEEVCATRRATFRDLVGADASPEAHAVAHRSHLPARGPSSICMHRDDARTVSHCRVRVTPNDVCVAYHDDSPCRAPEPTAVVRLPRA